MDGDSGMGVLLFPVLADKSIWRVKWVQTGIVSTQFVGSAGRFHLKRWDELRRMPSTAESASGVQRRFLPLGRGRASRNIREMI